MKKHIITAFILAAALFTVACEKLELPPLEEDGTENTTDIESDSLAGSAPIEKPSQTPTINDTIAYIQSHGDTPETAYKVRDFKTHIPAFLNITQGANGWDNVYATGYIVGYTPKGAQSISSTIFGTGETETNIVIADSPTEINPDSCIAVELTLSSSKSTETRKALNLSDNPQNLHKKVIIFGNIKPYKRTLGIKNARKHTIHTDTLSAHTTLY